MWLLMVLAVVASLATIYLVVRLAVAHGIQAALKEDSAKSRREVTSDLIGSRRPRPRRQVLPSNISHQ